MKNFSIKRVLFGVGAIFGGLMIVFLLAVIYYAVFEPVEVAPSDDASLLSQEPEDSGPPCNVYRANLYGDLVTYNEFEEAENGEEAQPTMAVSDEISWIIDQADEDPEIKAILLVVDSWGGYGPAGEEVAASLKRVGKPTIALIKTAGTSAAYLAASGASTIYASELSDVGSIGITMSYVQNAAKNAKDGLEYIQLSAGKYKDAGDPDKPLTAEERALAMRDLKIHHDAFIRMVAENRNLPTSTVARLADGSSLPGKMALEAGLIDKLGTIYDVEDDLEEKLGEPVVMCE